MSPFQVALGDLDVRIHLPAHVRAAMLPAYLLPVTAAVFPRARLELHFLPLAGVAPIGAVEISGEYGLGRASCIGPRSGNASDDNVWRFFVHLPEGPERPDRLPTKCVIPCLYIALRALGIHAVHASAVARDQAAIVIAGATGRGKSTTAAALTERGAVPIADDRVLLQARDDRWWVTASPERPNPFARRAGYPAEVGPAPRRVLEDRSAAFPLAQLLFPQVRPDEESRLESLSEARAALLLATAGGPPVVQDPLLAKDPAPSSTIPLPPAVRLTLGREAATIFSRL